MAGSAFVKSMGNRMNAVKEGDSSSLEGRTMYASRETDSMTDASSGLKTINVVKQKNGSTVYTRGTGKVIVAEGVTVKNTKNGNTMSDILTVSKKLNKSVYVISGHRAGSTTSEHYKVAVDIYVEGATKSTAPTYRGKIYKMDIFNRVASYHDKNTVHLDYKTSGNQGQFHDSGKGWVQIDEN